MTLRSWKTDSGERKAGLNLVQGNAAGEAVHGRVEALIEEHPRLGYRDAMRQVLDADPVLKAQYAGVQS